MKPQKRRTSVDPLPTIMELQEPPLPAHTMDDYMESIRELSQPTYPLSGPLRRSRLTRHHTAPLSTVIIYKSWPEIGPLTLDSKAQACSNQDPLDWLFAKTQHGGTSSAQNGQEHIGMI